MKPTPLIIYKTLILATAVVLVLWVAPWLYSLLIPAQRSDSFIYYSPYTNDFITRNSQCFCDFCGHCYTDAEADSLLPYFFYRQLDADKRLPDTLFGVPTDTKRMRRESFTFKTSPAQITKPRVPLYELLDAESGRVDLQLPKDAFRLTDNGLEFITAETNAVDAAKSAMFNSVLRARGCVFPIRLIAGNPTTRKSYDNGYLLYDSEGHLFNLRMIRNAPQVRVIPLPEGMQLQTLFVTEFDNRRNLGFVVSTDNQLYTIDCATLSSVSSALSSDSPAVLSDSSALSSDGTAVLSNSSASPLRHIDIPEYNPLEHPILIMGNEHDWTIRLTTPEATLYYAVSNTDYSLLAERIVPDPSPSELPWSARAYHYVCPLRLSLRSWQSPTIFPRFNID